MNTESAESIEPQAANVTSHSLYFWTTGENMTEMARDFVREGRHEAAAQLLMDSLGMTWDQAFSILKGESKLTGNSKKIEDGGDGGLSLEDDSIENPETAAYLQAIQAHYGGRFRHNDHWYRPYAYVTGFGRKDIEGAYAGEAPPDLVKARHWGDMPWRRAMHYADNPKTTRAHILPVPGLFTEDGNMDRWVLFERCSAPPVWLSNQNANSPEKALRDWLCHGRPLQARGPEQYLPEAQRETLDEQLVEDAVSDPLNTRKVVQAVSAATRQRQRAVEKRRHREEALRQEEEEAAREARWEAKLAFYRKEIREKTEAEDGGGYMTLTVKREGGDERPTSYQIPRYAFEVWSLWRTNLRHLAPKWETVCEQGLKMYGDDATHSDWMVGAEPMIPLDSWHGSEDDKPLFAAALDGQEAIQSRVGDFEVAVMCGTGQARGEVVHPDEDQEVPAGSIIVIPFAGPEYAIPAMSAGETGCIITQTGGRLSHLSILGREMNLRMVRIEDAIDLYPEGTDLHVDLNRGRVTLQSRHVRGMLGEF